MTDSNPNNFKTTKEAIDFVKDFYNTPFDELSKKAETGEDGIGTLSDPPLLYEGEKNNSPFMAVKYEIRGDDEFGYYISEQSSFYLGILITLSFVFYYSLIYF